MTLIILNAKFQSIKYSKGAYTFYMKTKILLTTFLSFNFYLLSSQIPKSFQITQPILDFDGRQLSISYDLIDASQSDQFYVWVEIERKNGGIVKMKTARGDIGDKIIPGKDKKIIWIPENDSIFLNEVVYVEIKAEMDVKSFNKGSMILLSTAVPGLGQTKIYEGKPYWIIGAGAYGVLAAGVIFHQSYLKSYNSYSTEADPVKRQDLLNKSQKQLNISGALIITGAAVWLANLFWVAVIPEKYKPLQHVNLTLDQSSGPYKKTTLLSLKLNF